VWPRGWEPIPHYNVEKNRPGLNMESFVELLKERERERFVD
jgi:hypothetical protein